MAREWTPAEKAWGQLMDALCVVHRCQNVTNLRRVVDVAWTAAADARRVALKRPNDPGAELCLCLARWATRYGLPSVQLPPETAKEAQRRTAEAKAAKTPQAKMPSAVVEAAP